MNIAELKKVYIVGIKGSGVVAIAQILKRQGVEVCGSDTEEKFFTDEILKREKISFFENFSPSHLAKDIDLVIYSTAYNEKNNIEFREAKSLGLNMKSYPEILGEIFNQKYGLAVCGTHGKTTTSAMLAYVLKRCEVDPSAVIGSQVKQWQGNALVGKGDYFVIEADEYQNKFKYYNPKGIILTSLDFDHPDYFKDFSSYKKTFTDFIAKIPVGGFLVVWGDNADTLEIANNFSGQIIKYGFGEGNDYKILKTMQDFEIIKEKKSLGRFEIQLVGKHNVLNATAVIATCQKLGLDIEKVREALKTFRGTSRRFEYIGERNGAILIDDYGHHPEEIKVTLEAAREIYLSKNIWIIFHPHSFTRTEALLQDFSRSFSDADKVVVLDIYGSAREDKGKVNARDLVELINKVEKNKAIHIATINQAVDFLKDEIRPDDVVITMGAGNVFEVAQKLKEK